MGLSQHLMGLSQHLMGLSQHWRKYHMSNTFKPKENEFSDEDSDDDESIGQLEDGELQELLHEARRESNPIRAEVQQQADANNDANVLNEANDLVEIQDNPIAISDTESLSTAEPRRSTRDRHPPERLGFDRPALNQVKFKTHDVMQDLEMCHNIMVVNNPKEKDIGSRSVEYDRMIAGVAARYIHTKNEKALMGGHQFGQQYIVQKGLKKFGEKGKDATLKELAQLHDRVCFEPILVSELSPSEKKKAQEALMFITEKRDGKCKGRMVYNGKPTRDWHSKDESASPTASLEAIFLTAVIDAKEKRDVMSCDIPNAFIQASMPAIKDGEDRVIMKMTGVLLELLVEMAPEIYGPYVVMEGGKRVLYLHVLRALYGMLVAALVWYRKFRADLEEIGFMFNAYDPCVANRWKDHKRQTIRFHVDDLMSSHVNPGVNDEFLQWLNKKYGEHGEVVATRGKVHEYLGMKFDFSVQGQVTVDMREYMSKLIEEFPVELTKTAPTPAAEDLFSMNNDSPKIDSARREIFHTFTAKALFACKRARPDLQVAVALLCTRVKDPNEDDWKKLLRLLHYIKGSINDVLILRADDLTVIKWYVDASFAVHQDFKSHTGASMTFGNGAPIAMSKKQKLNTRSSTEAELVGVDDAINMILWTKLFLEEQGYKIGTNVIYQDNKSAILLEKNGKRSSSKRPRALNI